uniref:Thioredoxin domain-containing protein n=1 Tax=Amphora coffeiformis TaxID=265554 RepID=A0A7S3L487_9STRA|eukprot:scaffold7257_cov177-Amphora_coffeaeformis.AAC.4
MNAIPMKRQHIRKAPLLTVRTTFVLSVFSLPAAAFHVPLPPTYSDTCSRRFSSALKMDQEKESEKRTVFAADSSSATLNATFVSSNALFSDEADAQAASFGDVVRPKYLSTDNSKVETKNLFANTPGPSATTTSMDEVEVAASMRRRNLGVAIASIALAFLNYFWQFTHPVSPVQLLVGMQENSAPVSVIGVNGKPTVVDFWAPWCENCKLMAPTMLQVEEEYKDKVNFVLVNGDKRDAWPLIEAFGVDAIPHIALVSSEGDVETALIGPVPKRVLEADLDVLISNAKLKAKQKATQSEAIPYRMLDVFAGNPDARRVHFDP